MKLEIKNLLGNSFDTMYDVEPSMMICTPALDPTEPIQGYTDLTLNAKLNAVSELNLCVHKITEDGQSNPCYGLVEKRKYIYMEGVGYFRITDCSEENSGDDDIKKIITAESKEAELGNINVPDLGTTDYKTGATSYTLKLYDANNNEEDPTRLKDCIIKRIENALVGWTFDLHDLNKTRARSQSAYTFGTSESGQESIGENIYNFLTTTVAEAFEVIFIFDTLKSTIIPIYRDQYYNKTSLFFDRENIVESSRRNEKEGTFCTCLELSPNEELIPYINSVNPTGKYLYDFSYYLDNDGWMAEDLKSAITTWQDEIVAAGEDASDPQVFRCLEAWTAERSMSEKARDNSGLYQKQSVILIKAQDTPTDSQAVGDALSNLPNLDPTVANRAAIKREDGTPVSNLTIQQGLKNINALENLCNALGFNVDYRGYFKNQTIFNNPLDPSTPAYYNIVPENEVNELSLGDRLTFRFRCTSLPLDTNNEPIPIQISLAVEGMKITDKDVFSVGKVISNEVVTADSGISIGKVNSEQVAVVSATNNADEYYEIKWIISGGIKINGSYQSPVRIYGNNYTPNTPNVKIKFYYEVDDNTTLSSNKNLEINTASFDANANDYYTYTNSDFIMDSAMVVPGQASEQTSETPPPPEKIGYHIWTPAFPVFNNMVDPNWNEGTTEVPIYPFNKETNIIDGNYIENIQYVTHSDEADLNPWFIANFNEVGDGSNGTINKNDINTINNWSYTPFTEDMVGGGSSTPITNYSITGYEIRLHFYGYVKIENLWTYKKLQVEYSDDYVDYIRYVPSTTLPSIPFTFPGIINTELPKVGKFKYPNEQSKSYAYTEVQYMRIEVFTGNANIFSTLTVVDPQLKHNATQTDLFSFNNGSLYPENYFNHLDPPLYEKLFPYINTLEYTNENIIVVDTDDMARRKQLASDFIAEAKKQFKQNIVPVMECTIDSGAEIFSRDYVPIRDELALGSFCQVEFDTDDYSELPLEEISINWQECNFSMTFGTFRKKGSRWADLISQTISNQKAMDTKTTKLYSYVLDDTLGSVSTALATNQINASALNILGGIAPKEAGYTITDAGATFTSKDEAGNLYQVLIADGSIACSKINRGGTRETTTALGKYVIGNTVQWGLYGGAIIAETITADKIQVGAIGGWTIDPNQMFHSIALNNYVDALISAEGVSEIEGDYSINYSIPSNGINNPSKTWKLLFGSLNSSNVMDYTFGVDSTGKLYARGADIQGVITATGGSFTGTITNNSSMAGWSITDRYMVHKTNDKLDAIICPDGREAVTSYMDPNGVNPPNAPGENPIEWHLLFGSGQKFGVDSSGKLYAYGADIRGHIQATSGSFSGTITSTEGSIGGWTIKGNSITNTQDEGGTKPTVSLISDGVIPVISNQQTVTGRTLVGNFTAGSSQSSSIRLPDYKNADVASGRTWQLLTGEDNAFNFGVTQDGRVYGKSFGAVDGLISSTLLQFYQRFHLSSYDDPYLDNAYNRLHMGNIYQPDCDDALLFPDGTDGTVGDNDYDGPLPVAGGLWQILIGYNDTFDFGINRWGVPFSSSTYYYQSVIGSGQARGETYPPGTIGTIPNVIADVSTSSRSHHGQIYIGDIDASQSSTFSGTFPDGQGYAAQTKNYLMLAGCDNNLKFGVDYEGNLTANLSSQCTLNGTNLDTLVNATASATTKGGVKVGSTLSVANDGTLDYLLPTASSTTKGGIKISQDTFGSQFTIKNDVLGLNSFGFADNTSWVGSVALNGTTIQSNEYYCDGQYYAIAGKGLLPCLGEWSVLFYFNDERIIPAGTVLTFTRSSTHSFHPNNTVALVTGTSDGSTWELVGDAFTVLGQDQITVRLSKASIYILFKDCGSCYYIPAS